MHRNRMLIWDVISLMLSSRRSPCVGVDASCGLIMVRALQVVETKKGSSKSRRSPEHHHHGVSSQKWTRAVRWLRHQSTRGNRDRDRRLRAPAGHGQREVRCVHQSLNSDQVCMNRGSEVRAMSHAGSFSSRLETSVHPRCSLLV